MSHFLSILCPTNRIGGLDVLFNSLAQQSNKNFELVLIDNIYRFRRDIVKERTKNAPFAIKHIEPRDNPFPDVSYCRTMNTGVAHAKGDLLLYLCDYCWLGPDVVEAHLDFYSRCHRALALDMAYTQLPPLHPAFRPYVHTVDPTHDALRHTQSLNESTERYVDDLRTGQLEPLLWSIFADDVTSHEQVWKLGMTHAHYRHLDERALDDYNYCCFKNESIPTEVVLELNGHDEEYDRSHGWQDSEFSYRMREYGIPWWSGPRARGEVRCLNPREVLNIKRLPDQWLSNKLLCDDTRRAGLRLPVNPGFSLREMREEMLGRYG